MAQKAPYQHVLLLANALIISPILGAIIALVFLQSQDRETVSHLGTLLATTSGYMCASAGATWLCRQLDIFNHRRYQFLLKCFYFTCITLTMSILSGSALEAIGEEGWFGLGTARWVGLVSGGLLVDKVEGAKEMGARDELAMGEEKHDAAN